MAFVGKVAYLFRSSIRGSRSLKGLTWRRAVVCGTVVATGFIGYSYQYNVNRSVPLFVVHAEEQKEPAAPQMSARKMRFIQFASIVYEEEPYMTPRDFLFSVMLENVDRKCMLVSWRHTTYCLISYTEYLFLLTILTKPRTGFHIAFKMLDVDGNEQVDKKEFMKVKLNDSLEDGDHVNTTLQTYFFGKSGENKLQYHQFRKFMEDLQAEVQEMEFLQFSKGMDTMRREDFAEWLLHYTNEEDNEVYWENMRKRIPAGQSITFEEFKAFCLFTNNLEDFAFSMKMISEANRPVGMAQFKRAVRIATGHDLSENVLDTVFKLFDMDGDHCLSHKEFIGVMKDRVLRGLKVHPQNGFSGYWKCVKRETLKGAQEAMGGGRCPI
uniref:Mitochondrial calcium uptake 2 n=1 Tax=Hippocampus comes TaxID=109280 RepID=A0A3Q3D9T4_HIPCM